MLKSTSLIFFFKSTSLCLYDNILLIKNNINKCENFINISETKCNKSREKRVNKYE